MNNDLIKKGEQIIKELDGEPDMLSKWMAHYIAELMEKAKLGNKEELESAAAQCSQLIIKLWEMKINKQISDIKHQFWDWKNIKDESDEELCHSIKDAIKSPEELIIIDADREVNFLRSLRKIEDWLIEIYGLSVILNKPDSEVLDETVQAISILNDYYKETLNNVAKVFPDFINLELKDLDKTRRFVKAALRSLDKIRSRIIVD